MEEGLSDQFEEIDKIMDVNDNGRVSLGQLLMLPVSV